MNKPTAPNAAARVDAMRRTLMLASNEIRLGHAQDPETTARQLTGVALALMESDATDFEKVTALNETHANLLAGGLGETTVRELANLSLRALHIAYPRSTENVENRVRIDAIKNTSPERSFPQAYEAAWERAGHPIDPLIVETELLVLASLEHNHRTRMSEAATGAFDPHDDGESEPQQNPAFSAA